MPADRPMFNEFMTFDVFSENAFVRILLFDNETQVPLECRVSMNEFRNWMTSLEIKELWF